MIPVEVKKAGRLIVALDAGAWIDLVRDGAAQKSITHGHGPACSGIRKMVEYDVTPGRYQLQIGNAPTAAIHAIDRKSVVKGKSVSVRVDLGGRRIIQNTKKQTT